ncbi:hypothetical protein F5884DRAFT_750614 [Xylogone sp. PMI_703]|nr:hypothetical protein F5884DRAFT_750614 [Xylogone sp. PMI_703]
MPASIHDPQPRLLVNVIDSHAKNDPDGAFILYANSSSWESEDGYHTITWKQFANAINKAAFWLDEKLPERSGEPQTVAYLGPSDPRYYIIIAAASKSKRRLFIPDGRLTTEGLSDILKEINCNAWICTQELPSQVPGIDSLEFPSLEELLKEDTQIISPYPYTNTWDEAKNEIVCIIHTSGTTGMPKPIYLRNGFMSAFDSWNIIFSRHTRKITYRHMMNTRSLTTCAPQWLAGLAFSLNAATFIGTTTVMLPPDMTFPLSRDAVMKICEHTSATSIITPPSLIEDFYHDDKAFSFLKSLDYVCYLGAGLDHKIGDELSEHTNLFPVIGSTERGAQLSFESDDAHMWKSYDFVPEMGARFEKVSGDVYELHHDRTPESDLFQCCFYTFPDIQTMNTEELYTPVVDSAGIRRWVFHSRKDDLVKLSWLAKFHATHIEDAIVRHPNVKSVFVGGEGRSVPYIIIEPKEQPAGGDRDKFIDTIYDTVIYDVNTRDNDQIRIPREMVMLSDPDLPFKRTMKATLMRKEVEKSYLGHIEALYQKWEANKVNGHSISS